MKTTLNLFLLSLMLTSVQAQELFIADKHLKSLDGSIVHVNDVFSTVGTILIFWDLSDPHSCRNLENLQSAWADEVRYYGVNLVAICVDPQGMWMRVKPYVSGKNWECETFFDTNGDLKRLMGITTLPYTILLDGEQNIKCRYPGYCSGDESQVCDKIINCLKTNGTMADL